MALFQYFNRNYLLFSPKESHFFQSDLNKPPTSKKLIDVRVTGDRLTDMSYKFDRLEIF